MTREQRVLLAETVRDIANLGAGAMVFGQFVGGQVFSWSAAAGGAVLWLVLMIWAVRLIRETTP